MRAKGSFLSLIIIKGFILFSLLITTQAGDKKNHNKCDEIDGLRNDRVNCSSSGEVTCHEGWTGPLCNTAICREGCHPVHGYCTKPGECKCALGWRGKECHECVPLPGCKNGFCNTTSYECICESGWEGNYCSIPVCREGCHSSRGYCKLPNECRCRIGWDGEICDECRSLPGCINGYCTKPLECRCREGWTGLLCDTPICRENCSAENGFCLKPGECRCEVGWIGENCDTCFPYPGCRHGSCASPWQCNCEHGWKGLLCDQKNETGGNVCDRNPGVCLNGGTCIVAQDDTNYICTCSPLFTGKQCEYFIHSRTPIFPIFSQVSASVRLTLSTTPATISVAGTTSQPPSAIASSILDSRESSESSSRLPIRRKQLSSFNSPSTGSPPVELQKDTVQRNRKKSSTKENNTNTTGEEVQEKENKVQNTQLISTSISSSDFKTLDNRRRKSTGRKSQTKSSTSKQPKRTEKERVYPSVTFEDAKEEHEYLRGKSMLNSRFHPSCKPNLLKPPAPILLLELSQPTIDFNHDQDDDTISNTDANSPQANQIKVKNRFLRHHERTGQPSSFIPDRKVRIVSRNKPRSSRFPTNAAFIFREKVFDSFPPKSSNGKNYYDSISEDFSHLPPKTRINRRTGVPPSPPSINDFSSTSTIGRFSSHDDYELVEASTQTEQTEDWSQENPQTYFDEHYNGRVHIGDVTEVDKHAPLEAIVNAYIELKKLNI